jgi:hypothetical protein
MTPGWEEVLVTAQGDGTAITAAAATSLLTGTGAIAAKYTLPTNFFGSIGKQLIIEASGRVSAVATTPGTFRIDVRFGATVVFDGLAVTRVVTNAYNNVGWYTRIVLTARAIGTAANLMGQGILATPGLIGGADVAMPIAAVTALLPWNSAPAVGNNFDSTATQQVDLFFTQTAATGSCTLHQYKLSAINPPQ